MKHHKLHHQTSHHIWYPQLAQQNPLVRTPPAVQNPLLPLQQVPQPMQPPHLTPQTPNPAHPLSSAYPQAAPFLAFAITATYIFTRRRHNRRSHAATRDTWDPDRGVHGGKAGIPGTGTGGEFDAGGCAAGTGAGMLEMYGKDGGEGGDGEIQGGYVRGVGARGIRGGDGGSRWKDREDGRRSGEGDGAVAAATVDWGRVSELDGGMERGGHTTAPVYHSPVSESTWSRTYPTCEGEAVRNGLNLVSNVTRGSMVHHAVELHSEGMVSSVSEPDGGGYGHKEVREIGSDAAKSTYLGEQSRSGRGSGDRRMGGERRSETARVGISTNF